MLTLAFELLFVAYGGRAGNIDDTAGCESWHASLSARCIEVHRCSIAQEGKPFCPLYGSLFLTRFFV